MSDQEKNSRQSIQSSNNEIKEHFERHFHEHKSYI